VIADNPPEYARIGSRQSFLSNADGTLGVDHLIAYEKQPLLRGFIEDRLEKQTPVFATECFV